ncbi:MAG: class I SAM-dependent methyltransferase [Bacteroidetes bacterium]|nr:MAG: class I SAM-dependent methyltransferase [Bacteroidota bacterium]
MIIQFSRAGFLNHPYALLQFALGNKSTLHEVMLMRAGKILLGDSFDRSYAKAVLKEISDGDFIPLNQLPGVSLPGNKPTYLFGKFLYFIVRCARPGVMVETGVAHGVSSWTILNAMHKNGKGKLYSIDLPNQDLKSYNPTNIRQSSGWAVPDELRHRWDLRLGPSQELLPQLIKELKEIDVFFHDSDHSYENMTFEFEAVYDSLKTGGLILSDDVHKNDAFSDLVTAKKINGLQFYTKGGAAVK